MRITYIKLVNFANVYTATSKTKLEIDLSKSKNRFVLILGPNGCGKTSLLSNLHPFPFPHNADFSTNRDILLEGRDGEKLIHITHNGQNIKIHHEYKNTPNGITTKSYLSIDGVEKNPNGNVTSFKELVLLVLGLDMEFLRLVRLGSNVTSFMQMKSTERKKFTSLLLADADIYGQIYKKLITDSRVLNNTIKLNTEKRHRIKIASLDEADVELQTVNENLKASVEKQSAVISKISELHTEMRLLYSGDDLDKDLDKLTKEVEVATALIKDGNVRFKSTTLKELDKDIVALDKELVLTTANIENTTSMITMKLDYSNMIQNSLEDKRLMTINSSNISIDELNDTISEVQSTIDSNIKVIGKKDCSNINKDDIINFINICNYIKEQVIDVIILSRPVIDDYLSLRSKTDMLNYIQKKANILDDAILKVNMKLSSVQNTNGGNRVRVMYSECESTTCPYITYYDETFNDTTGIDKLNRRLKELVADRNHYDNIVQLINIMKKVDILLGSLPNIQGVVMDRSLIISCLKSMSIDNITKTVDIAQELIYKIDAYNENVSLYDKIDGLKSQFELINSTRSMADNISKEIDNMTNEFETIMEEVSTMREAKAKLVKESESVKDKCDNLIKLKEDFVLYTDKKDIFNELNGRLHGLIGVSIKVKQIKSQLSDLIRDKDVIDKSIEIARNKHTSLSIAISQLAEIEEELAELRDKYDELELVKLSVSPSKGIPLLLIGLYLQTTTKIVNELLNVAFKGNLEMQIPTVTEQEFIIPYSKNGIIVNDIARASQGETSFINLALSFALMVQSIKDYNILLLDEVDATLDQNNRASFLSIAEKQLDIIKSEQAFVVSHNNMFDNYDIDAICLGDVDVDNFKKINVIYRR